MEEAEQVSGPMCERVEMPKVFGISAFDSMMKDLDEIISMLVASIKTLKKNNGDGNVEEGKN